MVCRQSHVTPEEAQIRDGLITKRTLITNWYMANARGRSKLIAFAQNYMQYSETVAKAVGNCSCFTPPNEGKALDILGTITKSAEPMLDLILSNVVNPFFDNQKKETKRKKRKGRYNDGYDQGDESQDIDEYLAGFYNGSDVDDDNDNDDDDDDDYLDPDLPIKIAKTVKTATTKQVWRYHGKLTERDHPTKTGPLSRSLFSYSRFLFSFSFCFSLYFILPHFRSLWVYRPRSRPLALLSLSCSLF
jgi:hypothetical protein